MHKDTEKGYRAAQEAFVACFDSVTPVLETDTWRERAAKESNKFADLYVSIEDMDSTLEFDEGWELFWDAIPDAITEGEDNPTAFNNKYSTLEMIVGCIRRILVPNKVDSNEPT